MRYSVNHDGVPVGFVELSEGELVAGTLTPVAALDALRPTIREGSDALLTLGFLGSASGVAVNGAGTALRAAAELRFDLVDIEGQSRTCDIRELDRSAGRRCRRHRAAQPF